MKFCKKCKRYKELDDFSNSRTTKDKKYYCCKKCNTLLSHNRRLNYKSSLKPKIFHKFCSKCKLDKKIKFFYKKATNKDGYSCYCIVCSRELYIQYEKTLKRKEYNKKYRNSKNGRLLKKKNQLRTKFKISLEDFNKLQDKQKYKCAICKKYESVKDKRTGKIINLSLDHSHITGKIRGLLCMKCNLLIGRSKDNIKILKSAILYLKKYD